MSTFKSFLLGSISGIIEPFGGLIGSILMLVSEKLLPYALAFAAGCMVFVVISELVPEITAKQRPKESAQINHAHTNRLALFSFFFGFVLMMVSDL